MQPYIALWGSERNYRHGDDYPGPQCVDGYFLWDFWDKVQPTEAN